MTDIVRSQLQVIITKFGRSVCDELKRCEALLKDLCPNHKRETNLLVAALREGVVKDLINAPSMLPIESILARNVQKLHDNLGVAEHLAQWAVESWAIALGIQFNSSAIADKGKVGIELPGSTTQTNTPQSKAVQPTVAQKPVDHAAAFEQIKQQKILVEQKKNQKFWQKIGINGEKLAIDAPQWAAVIDEKANLMWAINPRKIDSFPNPKEKVTWDEARAWVKYVNKCGWCSYKNWRLPKIDELETLIMSKQKDGLCIDQDIFNDINSKHYDVWSSSVHSYSNYSGKRLSTLCFAIGGQSYEHIEKTSYVRLVRSDYSKLFFWI